MEKHSGKKVNNGIAIGKILFYSKSKDKIETEVYLWFIDYLV